MGDRGNVYITNEYGSDTTRGIYFYTHDGGTTWPEVLRQALAFGEDRWDDDQYLVRILASRMFKDIEDQTTGGGIGLSMGDNNWPVTIVDLRNQRVAWARENEETMPERWYGVQGFADFVGQDTAEYGVTPTVANVLQITEG